MNENAAAHQPQRIAIWLIMLMGIGVEYYLFRRYLLLNIISNYPAGIDQANYLYSSYSLYENILHKGFISAIYQHPLIPASFLFPIQAASFFWLFGASRLAALSLNFLYFALLQLMAVGIIKARTGHYSFGFLFIGLLLSTEIFLNYGNAADFRIDFMALCVYGMWVCTVVQSRIFLHKNGTLISSALAILLISIRFITATYIAAISLSCLLYYVYSWCRNKTRNDELQRIKNIFLFGIIVSLFVIPLFWLHRDLIFSYYVYGHILGPEKWERAKFAGITNEFSNLLFYPTTFFQIFLTFPVVMEITLVLFLLAGLYWPWRKAAISPAITQSAKSDLLFLVMSIVIPLTILTFDRSKSSIVSGIIIVPFILLIVWIYWILIEKITAFLADFQWLEYLIMMFFLLSGGYHYLKEMRSVQPQNTSLASIKMLINDVGNYAASAGWKKINAAADKYTDFFAAIPAFYYEMHQVLFDFTPAFGAYSQLTVANKQDAFNKIDKINIFVTNTKKFVPNPFFLFEKSIAAFQPALKEKAVKHMTKLGNYMIYHSDYEVYVRQTP